jgi:hypothetical protein
MICESSCAFSLYGLAGLSAQRLARAIFEQSSTRLFHILPKLHGQTNLILCFQIYHIVEYRIIDGIGSSRWLPLARVGLISAGREEGFREQAPC